MDIIERIRNGEEISVDELINLDMYIIQELFDDDENYTIFKKMFDYCITHTETDDSKILHLLGGMYEDGKGVEQNWEEAMKYYKMAFEKGNVYTMNNLGYMYQNGNYVEQNDGKAIKYYKMAVKKGDSVAMYNLGSIYEKGNSNKIGRASCRERV